MERYAEECKMLAYLAKKQLNLPKNSCKENFESIKIQEILKLLCDEIREMHDEIFQPSYSEYIKLPLKIKENIDFVNLFNEIGDCAAVLVGLLAWVNKYREFITDDCA